MGQSSRHRNDRTKNLVGFCVGDVRYAVEILRVREIINPLSIVPLPHAPPSVLGVADHRGLVVPVLDLRRRFGLAPEAPTRRTKWIIVESDGRAVGLVVDAVTEVFGAGVDQRRDVPRLGSGDEARGIAAVFATSEGLWFVIDVDRVAAPAQALDVPSLSEIPS
ncbi:MAG: chemotaxis protein CheW [Myxococcota bacterium]|jgi:purine-binding chemotaxis protein CheW|nr:chemotaxis protein CheW [Myxococcota bacterium]